LIAKTSAVQEAEAFSGSHLRLEELPCANVRDMFKAGFTGYNR
jgi:hypothetical protein